MLISFEMLAEGQNFRAILGQWDGKKEDVLGFSFYQDTGLYASRILELTKREIKLCHET